MYHKENFPTPSCKKWIEIYAGRRPFRVDSRFGSTYHLCKETGRLETQTAKSLLHLERGPAVKGEPSLARPEFSECRVPQEEEVSMYSTRLLGVLALFLALFHLSTPTLADGCSTRCGIAFIPNHLTFAAQAVGTTSKPLAVRLLNSLPFSTTVGALSTTGPFHAATNCPKTLPAEHSCFFSVTFRPLAKGAASGMMRVTLSGVAHSVPLAGTGN
jgi:hypothetical protein